MLIKHFQTHSSNGDEAITNLAKFLAAGCAMSVASQLAYQLISVHGKESPDNASILKSLTELVDLLETVKVSADNLLNLAYENKQALNNQVVKFDE